MPEQEDDYLDIPEYARRRLKIARHIKRYGLEDVLKVLPKEKDEEIDWGRAAGKEIW